MTMARSRMLRLVGAVLLLIGGAVHLKLNLDDYGTEDISRTFAINAGASALVALYLLLRNDILGPLAGIAVSVGTLIGFGLSRQGDGILDFREVGFNPSPDAAVTVAVEALAIVVLAVAALQAQRATSSPRS
ncbi:MAG: hypothetical protein ABIP36_02735 [Acidimicrobiales bacterium]